MSEPNYKDQTRKFDEAGVALLRADINATRCDRDKRLFERKRAVAKIVKDDLAGRGQFIYTRTDDTYFFDAGTKSLEHFHDVAFRSNLYGRYGLNKTEEEARFVEADLEMFARTRGELCEIHQLSHWDDRERVLYVSANDGTMFKLDGHTIEHMDNGQRGVLFRSDRRTEPVSSPVKETVL